MRFVSTHHVNRNAMQLAALTIATAGLYVAGGVGMAYIAGFDAVGRRLADADWWLLAPSFAAIVLAFVGYFFAYRGINRRRGVRSSTHARFSRSWRPDSVDFSRTAGARSTSLR